MSIAVKVVAYGIIALCLAIAALFYMQSITIPSMQHFGNKFFGLAVVLIFVVIIFALAGIKIRLS